MSLVLERHMSDIARWKRGPGAAAAETLLGDRVTAIRLDRVHFPGARPVQLVYTVRLSSGLEVPVLAEYCPDGATEHAARATASLMKSRNGQRAALARAPIVADPASMFVLRRPGLDERLPGLRLLHDTTFVRSTVAKVTGKDPGPVSTRLMAHRLGKRAVIRIDAHDHRLYARLRAIKSDEGEARLQRHRAIWDALGPNADLAVPEPLGSMSGLGLSLFANLPGHPPRIGRDEDVIAQALATMRALDLHGLPTHSGTDEARLLQDWHVRCRVYGLELADRIAPLLDRTCDALAKFSATLSPCHRDLHEKQILVADGRAGLLDFDTLSLADPALDPGNLLAHVFLAGLDERPLAQSLDIPNLALWRRAALLRLAMIYAFTAMPDALLRRLLDEAAK